MTPKQVVQHFGSPRAVSQALGITQEAVYQWIRAGEVPQSRQFQLQVMSEGRLRVTRSKSK